MLCYRTLIFKEAFWCIHLQRYIFRAIPTELQDFFYRSYTYIYGCMCKRSSIKYINYFFKAKIIKSYTSYV